MFKLYKSVVIKWTWVVGVVVIVNKDIDYLDRVPRFRWTFFLILSNSWLLITQQDNVSGIVFVPVVVLMAVASCGEVAACSNRLRAQLVLSNETEASFQEVSTVFVPLAQACTHTSAPGVFACNPFSHQHLHQGFLSDYVSLKSDDGGSLGTGVRQEN